MAQLDYPLLQPLWDKKFQRVIWTLNEGVRIFGAFSGMLEGLFEESPKVSKAWGFSKIERGTTCIVSANDVVVAKEPGGYASPVTVF